jgi:hypothetical protein
VTRTEILSAVNFLYTKHDIPPPSFTFPIAPMGPLIDDAEILCTELPGLTSRMAERHLLLKGGLREPFPEGIVDETNPLSGFLYIAGGNLAHVFLRLDDPGGLVRRRFSLAHELGHLELHYPPNAEVFHDCYGTGEKEDEDAHVQREREANQFAAELLMPENVVCELADHSRNQGFFGMGLAEELAMLMLVSSAAMTKRLRDLQISLEEA